MKNEQFIKREYLTFAGIDSWDRIVFKHQRNGCYFCTVDRLCELDDDKESIQEVLNTTNSLYVKSPSKDFEGEPNQPVRVI